LVEHLLGKEEVMGSSPISSLLENVNCRFEVPSFGSQ
jgi:hypothetical protein